MQFIRKKSDTSFWFREAENGLPLLISPLLDGLPGIRHAFTTRLGGVSEGHLASLNLSFKLEAMPERTLENFRRAAETFRLTPDRVVLSDQTHGDVIRVVTEEDAGKEVTRDKDYEGVDGLVTNVPGLLLMVVAADCVPILFADPEKRVIAAVHSGWRGTALSIGGKAVRKMTEVFGCDPKDVRVAIGPSICRTCYEVGSDVAGVFLERFQETAPRFLERKESPDPTAETKYLLDLWEANRLILESAGLRPENIFVTDVCTACNPGLLFSHRAGHGKKGLQGAMILL